MRRLWLLVLALAACGEDPAMQVPAKVRGEMLFNSTVLSSSEFNRYTCATCHSVTEPPPEGRIDSGYSLRNTVARPSWWGGYQPTLLDAVNTCLEQYMRANVRLAADSDDGKSLYEYLASISPDPAAPALPVTIVKDILEVDRGDAARGAVVYDAACKLCHGALHSGEGGTIPEAVVMPEYFATFADTFPGVAPSLIVIEKVRHGKFFMVGGYMPFYSVEAMSDADLGALLAYLGI